MIALTALLMLALAAIGWQGRMRWNEAQAKRRATLDVKVKPVAPPPFAPAPKPDAAPAAKYADVATKDLFSKDRNPNIVIDPPKAPGKKMPPFPVVYGVLGLPSGVKALMSEKPGDGSRVVRAGDSIGEFKIDSLDSQNVVFDWDGKQISKKIEDLIDRSATATARATPAPAAPAAAPAAAARPAANNNRQVAASPGAETGPGTRACVPGDSSPAGTVADGYRKNLTATPFGSMCNWVRVQ